MEKNIKDYLPLYLGCQCEYFTDEETISKGILRSYDIILSTAGIDDTCMVDVSDIKLILRPVNDMTDDEVKEVIKFSYRSAESFRWHLNKGFDIFELIESGLAIDKTILKQKSPLHTPRA